MKNNNQHIIFDDLLSFYESRLDLQEANLCRDHLNACKECQNTLEAIQEFNSIELRQPHLEYANEQLEEQLLEITKQHIKASQKYNFVKQLKYHFYGNGWRYLVAVAASLLLVAFLNIALSEYTERSTEIAKEYTTDSNNDMVDSCETNISDAFPKEEKYVTQELSIDIADNLDNEEEVSEPNKPLPDTKNNKLEIFSEEDKQVTKETPSLDVVDNMDNKDRGIDTPKSSPNTNVAPNKDSLRTEREVPYKNYAYLTGYIIDKKENQAALKAHPDKRLGARTKEFPLKVSLKEEINVGRQHGATCVSHAIAHAMTIMWVRKDGISESKDIDKYMFSPHYIHNQISDNCTQGTRITEGLGIVKEHGIALATDFNSDDNCTTHPDRKTRLKALKYRIKDYLTTFSKDYAEEEKVIVTKKQLANGYPVIIGINIPKKFYEIKKGAKILEADETDLPIGGQALCVVGYDEFRGAFEVMNSWGADWANNGYIWIEYDDYARYAKYGYIAILGDKEVSEQIVSGETFNINTTKKINLEGKFAIDTLAGYDEYTQDPIFKPTTPVLDNGTYFLANRNGIDSYQLVGTGMTAHSYMYVFSIDYKNISELHFPKTTKDIDMYAAEEVPLNSIVVQSLVNERPYTSTPTGGVANRISDATMILLNDMTRPQSIQAGTKNICVIYSYNRIDDIQQRIERVRQATQKDFNKRLKAGFEDILIPAEDIEYATDGMGFKATSNKGTVVPLILNVSVDVVTDKIIIKDEDKKIAQRSKGSPDNKKIHKRTYPGRGGGNGKPNLYVLAIGATPPDINYTREDANDVYEAFMKQENFADGLYGEVHIEKLLGEEATAAEIVSKTAKIALGSDITRNDVFILYISSHGYRTRGEFRIQGSDFNPLVHERTSVSLDEMLEPLNELKAKKLVFLDASESIGKKIKSIPSMGIRGIAVHQSVKKILKARPGYTIISSSRGKAFSHSNWENGAFTEAFLEGINGKANEDNNNIITIGEINAYLKRRVPQLCENVGATPRQQPDCIRNELDDLPFFVLKEESVQSDFDFADKVPLRGVNYDMEHVMNTKYNEFEKTQLWEQESMPFFYKEDQYGEKYLQGSAVIMGRSNSNHLGLRLEINIAGDAYRHYGPLNCNTPVFIHLSNKKTVLLQGCQTQTIYNEYKDQTEYKIVFDLYQKEKKQLHKNTINYVEIGWIKGREQYKISKDDALIQQFNNIRRAKENGLIGKRS